MEVGETTEEICLCYLRVDAERVVVLAFVLIVYRCIAVCYSRVEGVPDYLVDTCLCVPLVVIDTLFPCTTCRASVCPEVAHLHHRDAVLLTIKVIDILVTSVDEAFVSLGGVIYHLLVKLCLVNLVNATSCHCAYGQCHTYIS